MTVELGLTDGARPAKGKRKKDDFFYSEVSRPRRLKKAWAKVYQNGISSKCERTRREVHEFSQESDRYLDQIYRSLLKRKWKFETAEGIEIPRPGKDPRPIVRSPIPSRIVQRSLLDVLQDIPDLEIYYNIKTSFGGLENKGVRQAIEALYLSIRDGAKFYLRTDIEGFFRGIPKQNVLDKISHVVEDPLFNELLKDSLFTELSNLDQIRRKDLFPTWDIGVAQGCCLSPLIGNILLSEFDAMMNGRGITCLRYIDDFIILSDDENKIIKAFEKANLMLKTFGLKVYDPSVEKEKAQFGEIWRGLEFLGCEIYPSHVCPSKKSRERLITNLKALLRRSKSLMRDPSKLNYEKASVTETLFHVSNILKGWGNQYSFCNSYMIMRNLDLQIDALLNDYFSYYAGMKKVFNSKNDFTNLRRLIGVHVLTDSKSNPILSNAIPQKAISISKV